MLAWGLLSLLGVVKRLKLKRKKKQKSGVFFKLIVFLSILGYPDKYSLTFQLLPFQVIRGDHTAFLNCISLLEIPLKEILIQSPRPLLAAGSDASLQYEKQAEERSEGQLFQFKMNCRRAYSKPMPTTNSRVKTWAFRGCLCSYRGMGARAGISVFSVCFLQSVRQVENTVTPFQK